MSFPSYGDYRDGELEWVGLIPRHWTEARLRWVAERYAGGTPDKAQSEYWTNGTIPWLNSGTVNQRFITEPSAHITEEAFANSSTRWVPARALVIALAGQGKTKGMVAQLGIRATCNQSMAAIVPTTEIDARYLFWWLTRNYENIRNMAGGDLRDGLNLELIGDIPCPLPPNAEQRLIAAFLDRETTKFDALVAEQQWLIELSKEKRHAVISHAVTKGLHPDAPLDDSGVEWLGEVPAHWEVRPLKSMVTLAGRIGFRGYTTADIVEEGQGAITLSPSNLIEGKVSFERCSYISWAKYHESPEIQVDPGDIVMVKTGSSFGKVGMVGTTLPVAATINPQLLLLKNCNNSNPRFLFFSLLTHHVQANVAVSNTGGTIPTMTQEFIGGIRVPIPDMNEQSAIVDHLEDVLERSDALIRAAEDAILLLKERRSALIFAAVTGKIDVRGLEVEAAPPKVVAA